MTDPNPVIEAMARAIAQSHGLDFDEVCGVDQSPDDGYCDSGTCIASGYEEHDAAYARCCYRADARAAYAAMRDALRPVAWGYWPSADTDELPFMQPNLANMDPRYWTETPLYALPEIKP